MSSSETITDDDVFCEPIPYGVRRISRVPCKARGISDNHNAWNSYIDIPVDAKHGKELCCSNSLCANSGRKFRYCAMCALPVASRNFAKRHSHQRVLTPVKKRKCVEGKDRIPRTVEISDDTGLKTRSLELTSQEVKFLDLMQTRPPDSSPYLGAWIQSVLDATSHGSAAPQQSINSEIQNATEDNDRASQYNVFWDEDDEDSLDGAFAFEMVGKFSHEES